MRAKRTSSERVPVVSLAISADVCSSNALLGFLEKTLAFDCYSKGISN